MLCYWNRASTYHKFCINDSFHYIIFLQRFGCQNIIQYMAITQRKKRITNLLTNNQITITTKGMMSNSTGSSQDYNQRMIYSYSNKRNCLGYRRQKGSEDQLSVNKPKFWLQKAIEYIDGEPKWMQSLRPMNCLRPAKRTFLAS